MMRTTFAQVVAAQAKVCTTVLFAINAKVLVVIPKAITKKIMNNYESDTLRIINKPDKFIPEIWTRQLERVKIGTWFFGLLSVYEYRFTEWKQE